MSIANGVMRIRYERDSMELMGGCYCGAVRYRITESPRLRSMCFCRECQHIAGGGPAVLLGVPDTGVTYVEGIPKTFRRTDLDAPVAREFCETCGTHLISRTPRAPGIALIKVGSLDDPSVFGMPQIAIYLAEAQPYHCVAEGVKTFPRRPTQPSAPPTQHD